MSKENKNFKYYDSIELAIVRIEIFSFSNSASPFYWIKKPDGEIIKCGGSLIGSLKDIDDPLFAAREESIFIQNIAFPLENYGKSLYNYDTAKTIHRIVADSGMFEGRALIDIYTDGKDFKYCVGGSNFIYRKDGDKIGLIFDEVELRRQGLIK